MKMNKGIARIDKETYKYCKENNLIEDLMYLVKSLLDSFIIIKLPYINKDTFALEKDSKEYVIIHAEVLGDIEEIQDLFTKHQLNLTNACKISNDCFAFDLLPKPFIAYEQCVEEVNVEYV